MTLRDLGRKLRSGLVNLIGKTGFIHECEIYLVRQNAEHCNKISDATGVTFGKTSRVRNWSGNPSLIKVGCKSQIHGELLVFPAGGRITLGIGCFLGENSRIWSMEHVEVGDHVLISHNVTVMDTDSHELNFEERAQTGLDMLTKGLSQTKGNISSAPVKLADHVWVGNGSIILKGVTIGEKSIIAAGSVVTKDVPPLTLVAGNPARAIRSLADK